MYSYRNLGNDTSSVKVNNIFSKWFDTIIGVRQGDFKDIISYLI